MPVFPQIDDELRLRRLTPPEGRVHMVLDTDTYNEIDDQFAVVYSLLSKEKLDVEALYAAPFHNDRSEGPADGMERSYEEILRLLERLDVEPEGFVFRGATRYLGSMDTPVDSDAVRDLIKKALDPARGDEPLYVVAIGAITNVASAILIEPRILEHIVVVWLGGHALHWPDTVEFNLMQDPTAARVILDSGVPLVRVGCVGVTSHLTTTLAELEAHVAGQGAIGDYLVEIFRGYHEDHRAWAKEIWDISAVAWLMNPEWVPSPLTPSPVLTDDLKWKTAPGRHNIRDSLIVHRNPIFRDLFDKLAARAASNRPAEQAAKAVSLFNGENLDGWYTFIRDRGRDTDPKKVFTVQDGIIRVSGEEWGCITTNEEFENYHLTVEFKWGEIAYAPREDRARDCGVLVHSTGEDGGYSGIWMHSIEYQMIEGGTGDFLVVGDGSEAFALSAKVAKELQGSSHVFDPDGEPVTIHGGRINWWGRDPEWVDELGFRGKQDVEKPLGEWNTLECICNGDEIIAILNGVVVNRACAVKPRRGRIQLQSEGAEVFFRKVELKPLGK